MQTVALDFSVATAKLELGLDLGFSGQELLDREGANANLAISPARRYLSKVRACSLGEETL